MTTRTSSTPGRPPGEAGNLHDCLISKHELNQNLEPANVVDGLFAIARSLDHVARALRDLGNADASTPMGAIENLSKELKDGLTGLAMAIESREREEP